MIKYERYFFMYFVSMNHIYSENQNSLEDLLYNFSCRKLGSRDSSNEINAY